MAHQLFNIWGVGKKGKDNGLLIQTEFMLPLFKQSRIYERILAGVSQIIQVLEDPSRQNQYLTRVPQEPEAPWLESTGPIFVLFLFSLLIFGILFAYLIKTTVKSTAKIIALGSLYSIWFLLTGFFSGPYWGLIILSILFY
jgi:uncharacterized membrane protein YgcG